MDPHLVELFQRLAVALGLGLLVGLQREKVREPLAGIRTFALLSLLGAVSALLAERLGAWIIGLGIVGVSGLLIAGYVAQSRSGQVRRRKTPTRKKTENDEEKTAPAQARDAGLTTEAAALLMYVIGAYVMIGDLGVGAVVGGAVVLLLHLKEPMHAFVGRLSASDLRAIMQFVLIGLVILPVLPDEAYDPWGVLNLRHIWLMVVLIVGISLGGYVAFQLLGGQVGALLSGVLGGLISSTATTVSYARRSTSQQASVALVVGILLLATTTAQARVLGEIAVVAPYVWWDIALPLLIFLAIMAVVSVVIVLRTRGEAAELPAHKNPAELQSALIFGGLYAVVTLAVEAAKIWLGDSGLYGVAILSGLHDMDAITLTTARMAANDVIGTSLAWQLILTASLSNIVMKTSYAYLLGTRELALRLAFWNGIFLAAGVALLFMLPW